MLMTRNCGCDGSVNALRNRRVAVAASRKPESTKLIVAPVESRARRSDCLLHDLFRLPAAVGQSCNTTHGLGAEHVPWPKPTNSLHVTIYGLIKAWTRQRRCRN